MAGRKDRAGNGSLDPPEGTFADGLPISFDRGHEHKMQIFAFLKESENWAFLGLSLEGQTLPHLLPLNPVLELNCRSPRCSPLGAVSGPHGPHA